MRPCRRHSASTPACPAANTPRPTRPRDDFESRWLPVPAPAAVVDAPGIWKYDDSTMDFLTGNDDTASSLSYSATGIELEYTQEELTSAGVPPSNIRDAYEELPNDLPPIVRELALEVTAGRTNSFERAVVLQNFFRDSGEFTYSLEAPSGNGSQDLEAFLTEGRDGRTGYCEQFASAMAVMARALGIPARVAVGFLRPEPTGADTYVYSARDLHAWTELYFPGSGWVLFDPTPGGRTGPAPAYTRGELPPVETTSPTASSETTSTDATEAANSARTSALDPAGSAAGGNANGFPWVRVAIGVLGALLLGALLMVPRSVRRVRRESRWRAGTAESAWAELRDAATDLGRAWPAGRSPRAAGDFLSATLRRAERRPAAGHWSRHKPGGRGRPRPAGARSGGGALFAATAGRGRRGPARRRHHLCDRAPQRSLGASSATGGLAAGLVATWSGAQSARGRGRGGAVGRAGPQRRARRPSR